MAIATTMSTVDGILKEVYEDRLRDQLESATVFSSRIEKTSEGVTEDVGGKYVRFPIRTARNHGIGARLEQEALPVARTQGYAPANILLAYLYGAIELTGQTFELAERNPQAFASALDQEVNGLQEGLKKDYNRQLFGTSIGKLVTANAAGTTTTLVTSNAEAIYMEIGMVVDLYDNTDALKAGGSGLVITNIQKDTPAVGSTTITFTPAAGGATASGDYFTRDDSRAKEMIGLRQIVDNTGILYNINPATVPLWKAEVDDPGVATAISEGRMIQMVDRVRTNGGNTTLLLTSLGVRRAYFGLLSQLRQSVNTMELKGGFKGLAFATDNGDIPLVSDLDCQAGTMYFLNEKELKLYQAGDWSWMNRDGSMWQRVMSVTGGQTVAPFDAYQAMMFKYCQLGCHRRNSQGVIRNITEVTV